MELNEIFRTLDKNLKDINNELGFSRSASDEKSITFSGEKGIYRLVHDAETNIIQFDCAYEDKGEETQWNTVSRSLFELSVADDRDVKSLSNEIEDELQHLYNARKKVDLDKIKMPKAVSRTKAKNGIISYDTDSLANRFGTLYPEFKDEIKRNIAEYGEFLPETFFVEHGNAKVLDVIKNGTKAEQKKLFKMLGEVFEDGTNEVQDIIGVTILGEMKNDPQMMAVADTYMTEYMAGPVHEINKLTAKNNKYTKKLKNPPAYKPKKNKAFSLQNTLNQNQ
ncbi:MAG: hypothetical protein SO393_01560 [Eubacterium sp.]|nr:hypothetical protein [Oscillospiraceae bacterium]MDD6355244.1 hypothetical protein [Oscillospiraceae bacterium]MDY4607586.1 hypothetical protein [Eubacterium sp.]